MDENAELRAQNDELARENSLLKAKANTLEAKVNAEKSLGREADKAHTLKDVHGHTKLRVCEQQVHELSEGLVEHGDAVRAKEIHERAQSSMEKLDQEMKK